jgi:hypothetical protein
MVVAPTLSLSLVIAMSSALFPVVDAFLMAGSARAGGRFGLYLNFIIASNQAMSYVVCDL